jgi:LytS/YehU family sensor histidine kinase
LATVVAEEVERFRAAEMERLVSEAELRALHAQINPHFLFNALNTIYGIIPREAAEARRTVLNLSNIFRYSLQSDKILIPLSEELKIVTAYLEIERLRLGHRLKTTIRVDKGAEHILIPILSIQPLVENAIKHGLSAQSSEGWLRLTAEMKADGLTVSVEDSGAEHTATMAPFSRTTGNGVGLTNVTRRLELCFGPEAGVTMERGAFGTRVQFSIPRAEAETPEAIRFVGSEALSDAAQRHQY